MKSDPQFLIQLGQKIHDLRTSKRITQNDLCNKAGIARSQLVRLEQGDLNITVNTLKALADALEVTPQALVDFKT